MKNVIKKFLVTCFISISFLCQAQETKARSGYSVTVNSKMGEMTMTKEELKNAAFGVRHVLPELAAKASLQGFKFKCPGRATIVIQGDKLTSDAIQAIMGSQTGDHVVIYDPVFRIDGIDQSTMGSVTIELKK
jgi:hypothetical protein